MAEPNAVIINGETHHVIIEWFTLWMKIWSTKYLTIRFPYFKTKFSKEVVKPIHFVDTNLRFTMLIFRSGKAFVAMSLSITSQNFIFVSM